MRSLGVDLGKVRVGLAVSDPQGMFAQPLAVVPRDAATEEIAFHAAHLEVEQIVVGIPVRLDGEWGPEAEEAESFASALGHRTGLPIELWDERLSTKEAERVMRAVGKKAREQRGVVDKVAAAIILQSFLDSRRQK
jgi:putative Holliday junction resolvase